MKNNVDIVKLNYDKDDMALGTIREYQKENYIPRSVAIDVFLNVYSPDRTKRITRIVSHVLPIKSLFNDETVRDWIYSERNGVPVSDLEVVDAITTTVTENVTQALRDVYANLGFEVDHIFVDLVDEDDEDEDDAPNIKI